MASGQEDAYSYDLTALVDYEPQQYQTTAPPTIGVGGGRLNTPSPPTAPDPGIGVGTNTNLAQTNVTVGVGGTRALRQQTGRPSRPSGGGYLDDRPTVGHKTAARRSPKGKQPATRARRMEKNPDASRVKALRLPPAMPEVDEEAVPAEATVVTAEEVVVVAESEVEEAEVEETMRMTMTMTMTTPMPHLLSDRVPLHADEGDDGFSTMPKWSSNWLKSCKISDRWLRDDESRVSRPPILSQLLIKMDDVPP